MFSRFNLEAMQTNGTLKERARHCGFEELSIRRIVHSKTCTFEELFVRRISLRKIAFQESSATPLQRPRNEEKTAALLDY